MSDEDIKKLKEFPPFQAFEAFVASQIDSLNVLDDVRSLSNERVGEEAKARMLAKDKLYAILAPMLRIVDRRQPTEAEIKAAKDKFGL